MRLHKLYGVWQTDRDAPPLAEGRGIDEVTSSQRRNGMIKIAKFASTVLLATAMLALLGAAPVSAEDKASDGSANSSLVVSVVGLAKGDKATMVLSTQSEPESALLSQPVEGEGDVPATLQLPVPAKDGRYQLILEAPDEYFREPKGYFFTVRDSVVINAAGGSLLFTLISSQGRDYQPYRGPTFNTNPSADATPPEPPLPGELPYRMECIVGFSTPPKEPPMPGSIDSMGYHYAGPYTSYDNEGVWRRVGVVNPSVRHNIWPNQEFVVDHAYANRYIGGSQHWIETGWAEHSDLTDNRYLYQYDNTLVPGPWRFLFTVQDGTNIDVAVMHYSGNVWVSLWWNGSYWVQTGYVDVGFSSADNGYGFVEVYTYDGNHPTLPPATNSESQLNVNGWLRWDWGSFWWCTQIQADAPYHGHYPALYYDYYIHTD